MNKKKSVWLIALVFMLIALIMFTVLKKENGYHDYYWIPMLLGAVLLFTATRIK